MKTNAFLTSDYSLKITFSSALEVSPIKQLVADSVAPSELQTLKQDHFLSQQLAMKSNEKSLDPLIAKEFSESADRLTSGIVEPTEPVYADRLKAAEERYAHEFSECADLRQEYHMYKNRYDQAAGLAKTFEGKALTPDAQKKAKKLNHEVHVLHQKVESIRWHLQQESTQLKQAQQSLERIRAERQ